MSTYQDRIMCDACDNGWWLSPFGILDTTGSGTPRFPFIPQWYRWQREEVRKAVLSEGYSLSLPVRIGILKNAKGVYLVGEGVLRHDAEGFHLEGCEGKLSFHQPPLSSHSAYADFLWYELGDVICIGDKHALFCCFPKEESFPVAKLRLAAEELYRSKMAEIAAEK